MGTVYWTQSQGCENTSYQAPPWLLEHCFPLLPRHLGDEARLPPLTLPEPSALLVGMQAGAATVENSMEFPQKTKNGTAF